ncbi:uncharacterized protein E0L32_005139 [Thyridium curvatum]|uniref:Uncharacterized protein n=1 Tax=Thyridium curvatum TaxID=1093900 RepID=A0A507B812_9PEZI|nr:uncharacterized protein E0L32_005139 [Thyridium curvatum]TPX14744.1 hypothetical protein E0L32_005139 [Thyridium curvatum]
MRINSIAALTLASLLGVTAVPEGKKCNHNNCLRAVIANAFPDRHGVEDCKAYFYVTVTPSTTVTAVQTATDTILATSTATETTVDCIDSTETDWTTVTGPTQVVYYRSVEIETRTIPAYASACSGEAKYASACSCVGVTVSTITVDAVTATLSETSTTSLTSVAAMTAVTATETSSYTETVTATSTFTPIRYINL